VRHLFSPLLLLLEYLVADHAAREPRDRDSGGNIAYALPRASYFSQSGGAENTMFSSITRTPGVGSGVCAVRIATHNVS
jgi:hypothetical protein